MFVLFSFDRPGKNVCHFDTLHRQLNKSSSWFAKQTIPATAMKNDSSSLLCFNLRDCKINPQCYY